MTKFRRYANNCNCENGLLFPLKLNSIAVLALSLCVTNVQNRFFFLQYHCRVNITALLSSFKLSLIQYLNVQCTIRQTSFTRERVYSGLHIGNARSLSANIGQTRSRSSVFASRSYELNLITHREPISFFANSFIVLTLLYHSINKKSTLSSIFSVVFT